MCGEHGSFQARPQRARSEWGKVQTDVRPPARPAPGRRVDTVAMTPAPLPLLVRTTHCSGRRVGPVSCLGWEVFALVRPWLRSCCPDLTLHVKRPALVAVLLDVWEPAISWELRIVPVGKREFLNEPGAIELFCGVAGAAQARSGLCAMGWCVPSSATE